MLTRYKECTVQRSTQDDGNQHVEDGGWVWQLDSKTIAFNPAKPSIIHLQK